VGEDKLKDAKAELVQRRKLQHILDCMGSLLTAFYNRPCHCVLNQFVVQELAENFSGILLRVVATNSMHVYRVANRPANKIIDSEETVSVGFDLTVVSI